MLNKVQLIGRLGKDPETRYTGGGDAVTNFSIATTEAWKSAEGKKQEKTEWHNIVTFKRLAEICGEYLARGALVFIDGKIQHKQWEDSDGNKRYTTEIVAREMKMLGGKKERQDIDQPPPTDDGLGDDVPF